MNRSYNRKANELRPIKFTRGFTKYADGSVLVECGDTKVIVTAIVEEKVPRFFKEQNKEGGWLSAEYALLPGSTNTRVQRERMKISGRTQEIQRLIGRSLRQAVNLEQIGERTITIDADVIQADGGTRTASISGAYVALYDALSSLKEKGLIDKMPDINPVAAISIGIKDGEVLLDLDYSEDSTAEADSNLVMTGDGKIVEFQSTAEGCAFEEAELLKLLEYGKKGINEILELQREALTL